MNWYSSRLQGTFWEVSGHMDGTADAELDNTCSKSASLLHLQMMKLVTDGTRTHMLTCCGGSGMGGEWEKQNEAQANWG